MRRAPLIGLVALVSLSAIACGGGRASDPAAEGEVEPIENSLLFNNITLEQSDESGNLLWKVDADEVNYNEDQQVANARNPDGELYENGEAIYQVQAQRGIVQQDGEKIVLQGQVVATDLQSKAVLRGDELEWSPNEGVLIVRNNLRGEHPQVRLVANEARLYNQDRRMELLGNVNALVADPAMMIQGERLVWRIDDQAVLSNRPVQISRLDGDRVTDVAVGQRANVDLEAKTATLQQQAQIVTSDPAMQVNSNLLIWDVNGEILRSDRPVIIVLRQDQIVMSANRGTVNMRTRMAYLNGEVEAVAQRNQSVVKSDTFTWNMTTRDILAEGNVDYRQADPPLMVKGARATGRMENQTVVISGGRVVSEIVPQ
ncbi:MAG: LPS export ABC transporter periplasmic protein LptC [Kaiparowitsia implicata GSE-PSE-MK54-09C]|nr:LPS export ABC transporter periplasmic protein LptC [Kaiparowitsia implicata GSE-PSE-MK54-09C]